MGDTMSRLAELLTKLKETHFPAMGHGVGDFLLYDVYVKGCADAVLAQELRPPEAEGFVGDEESLRIVAALRAKPARTPEEQAFPECDDLLKEVRGAILARAGQDPPAATDGRG